MSNFPRSKRLVGDILSEDSDNGCACSPLWQQTNVTERLLKFPVNCPICKTEWTCALSVIEIKESLDNGTPIRAYAKCHDWTWDLKEEERQALKAKILA